MEGSGLRERTYFLPERKATDSICNRLASRESAEAALTKMGVIASRIIKLTLSQQIRDQAANVTLSVDDP